MKALDALAITALAVAVQSLIIPGCVQWNIGERIREQAEVRVGADVTQRFVCETTRQLLAPEVTYRAATPLITLLDDKDPAAQELTPTGYLREVSLPPLKGVGYKLPRHARTTVRERWQGAPPPESERGEYVEPGYTPTADSVRWLGCAGVRQEEGYTLAATLAAPFDYVIDPVLSAVSSAVAMPVFGFVLLVGVGYDYVAHY